MRELQDVILDLSPCFTQVRELVISKVSQQLQNLHEREGGKKQIRLLNGPPHLRQTITFPPDLTPAL